MISDCSCFKPIWEKEISVIKSTKGPNPNKFFFFKSNVNVNVTFTFTFVPSWVCVF